MNLWSHKKSTLQLSLFLLAICSLYLEQRNQTNILTKTEGQGAHVDQGQ